MEEKVKRFLNVQELTEYIHMSESYVYKMVSKQSIPHIKLGTRTLFERNQIDNWVINGGTMVDNLPSLPKV
jgi:excisionase family DNA binding protein